MNSETNETISKCSMCEDVQAKNLKPPLQRSKSPMFEKRLKVEKQSTCSLSRRKSTSSWLTIIPTSWKSRTKRHNLTNNHYYTTESIGSERLASRRTKTLMPTASKYLRQRFVKSVQDLIKLERQKAKGFHGHAAEPLPPRS